MDIAGGPAPKKRPRVSQPKNDAFDLFGKKLFEAFTLARIKHKLVVDDSRIADDEEEKFRLKTQSTRTHGGVLGRVLAD